MEGEGEVTDGFGTSGEFGDIEVGDLVRGRPVYTRPPIGDGLPAEPRKPATRNGMPSVRKKALAAVATPRLTWLTPFWMAFEN